MTIRFTCEYSGKNFCGFQRQKSSQNLRTVQDELEKALAKYFGKEIKIIGSGRTDAGVHARGQVCSFRVGADKHGAGVDEHGAGVDEHGVGADEHGAAESTRSGGVVASVDLFKLNTAINAFLPPDVSVRDFQVESDLYSAQFSARSKTYIYRCYVSPHRSALRADTHLQIYKMPDLDAMRDAAKMLVGTHDFKAFSSEHTDKIDFVRTITEFEIAQPVADEIHFIVRGNGFLRNMVRIMIGTILSVGVGKVSVQDFGEILASRDRKQAGETAPAHGLILDSVEY